ncbi:hypothetical protein N7474_005073 [Penicillium riverlandense]|uniref:uncharacterized protein n=1 Tax=Penicillium riverlandense TaxID=1903569 RepID=UPI002547C20A|nr:uncharacterized protein N7474_005073 [Penicillium riverlandense]KAJ5819482.1 hypothetical protein N7474_005073 [Penicillium riverlandense]
MKTWIYSSGRNERGKDPQKFLPSIENIVHYEPPTSTVFCLMQIKMPARGNEIQQLVSWIEYETVVWSLAFMLMTGIK